MSSDIKGLLQKAIEQEHFATCTASDGEGIVNIKFKSLNNAQNFYSALCNIKSALAQPDTKPTLSPRPYNSLPSNPKFDAFIRAFWRRIDAYKYKYEKELPEKMPVEFRASMETALLTFDNDGELSQSQQTICEWQPIKTAPKDGSAILATGTNFFGTRYYVVVAFDGHYWMGVNRSRHDFLFNWMPLPEPPK